MKGQQYSSHPEKRKRRVRRNMYFAGSLLAADCGAAGSLLRKSAVPFKHTEQGAFAGRSVGAE